VNNLTLNINVFFIILKTKKTYGRCLNCTNKKPKMYSSNSREMDVPMLSIEVKLEGVH